MLRKILNYFSKPPPTEEEEEEPCVKIWNLESDFKEIYPDGITCIWEVMVRAEIDGEIVVRPFYVSSEETVKAFNDHFKSSIEPLEVEL